MAPAASTNKRPRPGLDHPRAKTNGVSKFAPTKKSNIGSVFSKGTRTSKSKAGPKRKVSATTSNRVGVREQEPEEEEEEEEEEEDDNDDEEEEEEEDQSLLDDEAEAEEDPDDGASDADMMLAEITHDPPEEESTEPAIPIPLLHRLLHHSFQKPDTTKLSTDARACVAKYIEVFVREGIARCAFEVSEKSARVGSDSAFGHDDGWLEVEDLERVGGQLVLDF